MLLFDGLDSIYEVGLLCLLFVARIIDENWSLSNWRKKGSVTGSIDTLQLRILGIY